MSKLQGKGKGGGGGGLYQRVGGALDENKRFACSKYYPENLLETVLKNPTLKDRSFLRLTPIQHFIYRVKVKCNQLSP